MCQLAHSLVRNLFKRKEKVKIMKKKLVSLAVAIAMLFSLAAPAMAYDNPVTTIVMGGVEYWCGLPQFPDNVGVAAVVGLANDSIKNVKIVGSVPDPNGGGNYCIVDTISSGAFENSQIQSVQIPSTVKTINAAAFKGCSELSSVTFDGETCPTIAGDAFDGLPFGAKAYVPEGSFNVNQGYHRNYPFDRYPLVLVGYEYPMVIGASAHQKAGTVLMPGVEYPLEAVLDMITTQVDFDNTLIAEPQMYRVSLSDPSGTSATAVITNDTFTIAKNGIIRVTMTTADGMSIYKDIQMTVTPRQEGKKSSIQNTPQNSNILKGQFQMTLSDAQKAQLGDTYEVSFYYRVDPNVIMHNFMVYNTDGTMMADKGNGFYILQGKASRTDGIMGTSSVQLGQDSDYWSIYYGGELVATCDATNRWTGWSKVTLKYRNGGVGIFVNDVQRTLTTVKAGAVSEDNYINIAPNYKISKIGPIGTQGWRQPQFSADADLSGAVNYKTEMGRANFDTFTVTSGGTQVFLYACDSIPSYFSSIWQVKDLNAGAVIYNTPAFDYVWYQN